MPPMEEGITGQLCTTHMFCVTMYSEKALVSESTSGNRDIMAACRGVTDVLITPSRCSNFLFP